MTRSLRLVPVLCLVLAGCGISRAVRESPGYKAGYGDGCATASAMESAIGRDTTVRDDAEFKTDKNYRAGWSNGYSACRPALPSGGGTPSRRPVPDQGPGNGGIPF